MVEECEYGEHASVVLVVRADAELSEDARDVCLDGAFREPEPAGDASVGAALRNQREHLAFPWSESGQMVGRAEWAEQQRDDLWVECGAALRDAGEGVEELVDVEDPVLEQIAEASRADQLDRVLRFDVLREKHDP